MKNIKKLLAQFRMSAEEQEKTWRSIVHKTGLHKPRMYERYVFRLASIGLLIAALVISPVAYAAEHSLPGDAMYDVKTEILEPTKERLLVREEWRANYQKKLMEKREQELQKLEEKKEKSAEKINQVKERIQKQEVNIEKQIERLERKGKVKAAEKLREVKEKREEKRKEKNDRRK